MNTLMVANTPISIDSNGLYSLNDLHKASGNDPIKGPGQFLRTESTKELINVINSNFLDKNGDLTVHYSTVYKKEGRNGGTFACKEIVYAYAMWLSPEFMCHVIRAYDALATSRIDSAPALLRSSPTHNQIEAAMGFFRSRMTRYNYKYSIEEKIKKESAIVLDLTGINIIDHLLKRRNKPHHDEPQLIFEHQLCYWLGVQKCEIRALFNNREDLQRFRSHKTLFDLEFLNYL